MNNEINFLPESFIQAQAKQKRKFRQGALLVLVIVMIAGWYMTERDSLVDLAAYAQTLQAQADATSKKVDEMSRLRREYALLTNQLRIQRELAEPVSATVIIATIGRLMPEEIAISDLTMELTRPKPRPVEDPDAKKSKRKRHTTEKSAPEPHFVQLTLMGISPDDQKIAAFLGALTGHAMFTDVKLLYTRAAEADNFYTREFRVELKVPLDRDYQPVDQTEDELMPPAALGPVSGEVHDDI